MMPFTVGSLFSGIGGFELGLERTGGFKTVWQCEIDPFCQKVLEKHWPNVKRFTDIKKIGIEEEIPHVNVICGGFPCQPVSCAGKRKGKEDERWLWPEFYRVIRCVQPEWVLIENVPGLLSADAGRLFAGILRDLSESGYDAEWNIVSAASVGAPHLRKRVFIVAHTSQPGRQQITRSTHGNETEDERWTTKENNEPDRDGESGGTGHVADTIDTDGGCSPRGTSHRNRTVADRWGNSQRVEHNGCDPDSRGCTWTTEPPVGGTFDGFSTWLDRYGGGIMYISHKRIYTYGNEHGTPEEGRSGEILRTLRGAVGAEGDEWSPRGSRGVSAEEVLLAYLRKLSEASETLDDLSLAGTETQERSLRGMRAQVQSAGSSHRSRSDEQRSDKHPDSLQALSRLLAYDSQKAWASYRWQNARPILNTWSPGWESGIARVANGVPSRVDRLRALGNAIVPQCAQFVGQCLLDSIKAEAAQ